MNRPKGKEKWLTQLEAAEAAGVTDRAINYHIRNNHLDVVRAQVTRKTESGTQTRWQWLINPESLKEVYPTATV